MAPKATSVFKRCWISPLPYLAIIVIVTGAVGAIVTMAIGYAMVYRDYYDGEGLCFNGPPGIRRACILDLGGGVMSMTLGVLLLIIELVSAYINQKDWKVALFMIKIIIAVLTVIELGAGTIQGAASYTEFCNQLYYVYYSYRFVYCDFYNDDRKHDSDVDFLAVVIVTGIGAFFWIVLLGSEIFRLCILLMGKKALQTCILGTAIDNNNNNNNINNNNDNTRGTEGELQQLPTASPQNSEV